MNELMLGFSYLVGVSFWPAFLAFAATYYRKRGELRRPVSRHRRFISAVVIYVVCIVTELVLTMAIGIAAAPNPEAYESPFLIISGLLGYFAGRRVIESGPDMTPPTTKRGLMRRPAKIFIVGCCVSAAVYGLGLWNTHRLAQREVLVAAVMQAQCRVFMAGDQAIDDPAEWCADNLDQSPRWQGVVDQAHAAVDQSRVWGLRLALTVLALSAAPWLWYALLRRLAEVRTALGGNPPEG